MHHLLTKAVVVLTAMNLARSANNCSHLGTEFIFGIPRNYHNDTTNVTLDITTASQTLVRINVWIPTVHMSNNSFVFDKFTTIRLPGTVEQGGTYMGDNSVHVLASDDISLAVTSHVFGSTATFLVLPVHQLGTDYVAASYQPVSPDSSEIMIIGVYNDTRVTISKSDIHLDVNITLQRLQVYQYQDRHDLTHSVIKCSHPCAVISGSSCSQIGPAGCDVIMEFLLPTTDWGYKYIVPSIIPYPRYVIRILATTQTGISVHFRNSHTRYSSIVSSLNALQDHNFDNVSTIVESEHPISVFQYPSAYPMRYLGDPFMTLIPAVSQYLNSYRVVVPDLPGYSHYMSVILSRDKIDGLNMDGHKIITFPHAQNVTSNLSSSHVIEHVIHITSYATYNIKIVSGYHELTHDDRGVTFGAILFGYDSSSGYGIPAGLNPKGSSCPDTQVTSKRTTDVPDTTTVVNTNVSPANSRTKTINTVTVPVSSMAAAVTTPNKFNDSISTGTLQPTISTRKSTPTQESSTTSTVLSRTTFGNTATSTLPLPLSNRSQSCYSCDDMSHPQYCDTVATCASDQVCYLHKYPITFGFRYKSGCMNRLVCLAEAQLSHATGSNGCVECCNEQYCNHRGCGENGLPPRKDRGPVCFDCHHVGAPEECYTVALCSKSEICSVYEYHWGESLHYKMGCASQLCDLDTRSAFHVIERRSTPVCRKCCHDDFCNRNCTQTGDISEVFVG